MVLPTGSSNSELCLMFFISIATLSTDGNLGEFLVEVKGEVKEITLFHTLAMMDPLDHCKIKSINQLRNDKRAAFVTLLYELCKKTKKNQ